MKALGIFVALLALAPLANAQTRLYRQLKDTVGISYSQLASLCPRDGQTPCTGALAGWVWATEDQVVELIESSWPGVRATQSADPVPSYGGSGFEFAFYASEFFQTIKPTRAVYLTYSTSEFAAGITATLDANGAPMVGQVSAGSTPVSVSGGIAIGPFGTVDSRDIYTGAFLWRDPNVPLPPQPRAIDAVNDTGRVVAQTIGGIVARVLANDKLGGAAAHLADVNISQVSASSADISLDPATGSVSIRAGAAIGTYTLTYKICEKLFPTNCDSAVVTGGVRKASIYAGPNYIRASNKKPATLIANVLANDYLEGARPTTANVSIQQLTPTNKNIVLDPTTGAVILKAKVESVTYRFDYQICEKADPTNCSQATITLELSGGG